VSSMILTTGALTDPHFPLLCASGRESEQAMSFVDAGSGNPSSGSVDAIDVRHGSPRNIPRIPMTSGLLFFLTGSVRRTTSGGIIRNLSVDSRDGNPNH